MPLDCRYTYCEARHTQQPYACARCVPGKRGAAADRAVASGPSWEARQQGDSSFPKEALPLHHPFCPSGYRLEGAAVSGNTSCEQVGCSGSAGQRWRVAIAAGLQAAAARIATAGLPLFTASRWPHLPVAAAVPSAWLRRLDGQCRPPRLHVRSSSEGLCARRVGCCNLHPGGLPRVHGGPGRVHSLRCWLVLVPRQQQLHSVHGTWLCHMRASSAGGPEVPVLPARVLLHKLHPRLRPLLGSGECARAGGGGGGGGGGIRACVVAWVAEPSLAIALPASLPAPNRAVQNAIQAPESATPVWTA